MMAAGMTPWLMVAILGALAGAVGAVAALAAALFGGFALMAVVAIALLLLVGGFEAMVAWRFPSAERSDPRPADLSGATGLVADPPEAGG
jgi:hypothetical protein